METHKPAAMSLDTLRNKLLQQGGPSMESDQLILVGYQSIMKQDERLAGARSFLDYLHAHGRTLADAREADMIAWQQIPVKPRGNAPSKARSPYSIGGARGLWAQAISVGYLPEMYESVFITDLARTASARPLIKHDDVYELPEVSENTNSSHAFTHDLSGDDSVMEAVRYFLDPHHQSDVPPDFELLT